MQVVLALDAGTTSVRTLAVDSLGNILTTSKEEFPQHYPEPGLIEHDPEEIWSAAASTLKNVSRYNQSTRDFDYLGSGFWETIAKRNCLARSKNN